VAVTPSIHATAPSSRVTPGKDRQGEQTVALVRHIIGVEASQGYIAEVHRRIDGNPFFTSEVAKPRGVGCSGGRMTASDSDTSARFTCSRGVRTGARTWRDTQPRATPDPQRCARTASPAHRRPVRSAALHVRRPEAG
jgi:hypothetical protein